MRMLLRSLALPCSSPAITRARRKFAHTTSHCILHEIIAVLEALSMEIPG
jgi:hypothetical protein